ncbi:MAG: hypothetical protein ABJA20_10865, partial [Novosphingobium sp.]
GTDESPVHRQGVPVILGEYRSSRRDNLTGADLALNDQSRLFWMKYVTPTALANGLLPFVWDTGGYIDRRRPRVLDQSGLNAVLEGAGKK